MDLLIIGYACVMTVSLDESPAQTTGSGYHAVINQTVRFTYRVEHHHIQNRQSGDKLGQSLIIGSEIVCDELKVHPFGRIFLFVVETLPAG